MINGGYPLLREGLLELLNTPDNAVAIGRVIKGWNAEALEQAIADRGLCGVMVRTAAEWRDHPQGAAIGTQPVVEVTRIGEAPPTPFPPLSSKAAARPLAGIRVLDATHVIAGLTCAKSLAEYGATVLHVYCPSRPQLPPFDTDTGHGRLTCFLDLKGATAARDRDVLRGLARHADVFSQSYRSGAMAQLGFSPESLASMRPGIVVVSFDCYGWSGPWCGRPGWEQLAQCASGMAVAQGTAEAPALAAGAYPNDYLTGFLAALGTVAALLRRAEGGGSWHVRVALCRTAMMIIDQGTIDPAKRVQAQISDDYRARYMQECDSPIGRLRYLGSVLQMSATLGRWELPPLPLGAHPPRWPGAVF